MLAGSWTLLPAVLNQEALLMSTSIEPLAHPVNAKNTKPKARSDASMRRKNFKIVVPKRKRPWAPFLNRKKSIIGFRLYLMYCRPTIPLRTPEAVAHELLPVLRVFECEIGQRKEPLCARATTLAEWRL